MKRGENMRVCPSCNREYKAGEVLCPLCNTAIVETNEKGKASAISTLRISPTFKRVLISVCAALLSAVLLMSGVALIFYFAKSTPSLLYVKNGDLYSTCETGRAKKLKEDIFENMSEEEKDSFFEHLVKDEKREVLIYPAEIEYKISESENLKGEPALRGEETVETCMTLKALHLKNSKEYEIADGVSSFEYSDFAGKVIYEKEDCLYSYDIAENESSLLCEKVYYYTLSESGEYMIYSDSAARGTYWMKMGEEALYIKGISSFSKDLSTCADIDGEGNLLVTSFGDPPRTVAENIHEIGSVSPDGKLYYTTVEKYDIYYKDFVEDDLPAEDPSQLLSEIREYVDKGKTDGFKHNLYYFDGNESILLNSFECVDVWEAPVLSFLSQSFDYSVLRTDIYIKDEARFEKIKLSSVLQYGDSYWVHLAHNLLDAFPLYCRRVTYIGSELCERNLDEICDTFYDNERERVYLYTEHMANKRVNAYYSDIEDGKAAYPQPFDKNMLKDSIQYLPDGSLVYFKEYMDYKRSGYLYRDRELLDKDAHIDSVVYSEELDALFWISGSDKEMSAGTLMMQKEKDILPVAYGVLDYRVCRDGVYYTAHSLDGDKYDLYFFNGESTKKAEGDVDLIIE
ncbi:MAG: hypothetical protein IJA52_05320 [Clostridia bacterium]|nr:hypothetical protein [Clostridia bacterium]